MTDSELKRIAPLFHSVLHSEWVKANGHPKPIKGHVLVSRWNAKYDSSPLRESDIREIMNHLRTEKVPIASSVDGYWYEPDPDKLEKALEHQESRVKKQLQAIKGCKLYIMEKRQGTLGLGGHPIEKVLEQELGAKLI